MNDSSRKETDRYHQPDNIPNEIGHPRRMSGFLENVDYLAQSNIRFWHNVLSIEYPLHHHAPMEIIICEESTYTVIANQKKYLLHEGDILIIPPNMLHELKAQEHGSRFILLINMEIMEGLKDYRALDPIFMQAYLCTPETHPEIYRQIHSTFMLMIDEYFSANIFWESKIYGFVFSILSLIGREHFKIQSGADSLVPSRERREDYVKFSSLLNYLNEHYPDNISLDDAAKYLGFSKYYFTRLFKQQTGMTFYDYLSRKRISAAQAMLSTDLSITEIALRTGFNDPSSFTRCFKKVTDSSPNEYRSRLRQEHF